MDTRTQKYQSREIEAKWIDVWHTSHLYSSAISKDADISEKSFDKTQGKPFYNLMMFPYPSAEGLHIGNMYAFTGSDIYGRFKRMQGYNVFEPIGLDGFGIHSENYALKIGKHPMDHAKVTEKKFYTQLSRIGAMFDWTRTIETYDPLYYKWTQWLFVQMFKHGLAYRGKAEVNWCPSCKTVLADEQVVDGVCERCGNKVSNRLLEQWFFKITAYAEKLLQNIVGSGKTGVNLDWSEKIRITQQNWIGKKEGINITYPVIAEDGKTVGEITCFTTRPDTNFGATFVVMAPEHPFLENFSAKCQTCLPARQVLNAKWNQIQEYTLQSKKKINQDKSSLSRSKSGVFTGLYCLNQLNNNKMPLYVSDYVTMDFGTGVVVGVPGHDKRDFEFAKGFDIPIVRVVVGKDGNNSPIKSLDQVQEEEGTMVNSDFLNGKDIHEATLLMMDYIEKKGWGKRVTSYHLRDWLISRQRYWGPPIPMIYCEKCAKEGRSWFTSAEATKVGARFAAHPSNPDSPIHSVNSKEDMTVLENAYLPTATSGHRSLEIGHSAHEMRGWYPVPEDQLPVVLPYIQDYKPGDDGIAPLAKHKEFYHVACPECGETARRETDVSDTFLDSSWYFLRYPSVGLDSKTVRQEDGKKEIDLVFQQSESSSKASLPAKRVLSSHSLPWDSEIIKHWLPVDMYTGGAEHSVLHLMYARFVTMALHDFGYLDFEEPFSHFYAHGLVIKDGAKMSKSKGNVINPDEYIDRYGVDAVRLYLMFMGPFDQGGDFRDAAMEGMSRWIGRVWRLVQSVIGQQSKLSSAVIQSALQNVINKITDDMEKRRYNTAIASMMEFTNLVSRQGGALSLEDSKTFLRLLAPFAPFITEELWFQLNNDGFQSDGTVIKDNATPYSSIHLASWPKANESQVQEEPAIVVVQVNGKVRDTLSIDKKVSQSQSEVEALAKKSPKVQKFFEDKKISRVIFVPGKVINFVVL